MDEEATQNRVKTQNRSISDYISMEQQTLSELLAMDRTSLAHERTFLAYLRTAFTSLIAGVSLVKLFAEPVITRVGWGLVGFAALILIVGVIRLSRIRGLKISR